MLEGTMNMQYISEKTALENAGGNHLSALKNLPVLKF